MDFVKNLEVTHIVGGGGRGGGSCYLFHCDALYMKIDMWLTPYILTLLEPRNYDENSITIDFSIIFFQKNYLDLAVAKEKSNTTLKKKLGKRVKQNYNAAFSHL